MKSSDRMILIGVGAVVVIAAFWLMVISPKRKEASDLSTQITGLQAQIAQSDQESAAGEQAKGGFSHDYRRLVAIGKAIPDDADTPSLLTQMQSVSSKSKVDFRSITLTQSTSAAAAPATAITPSTDPAVASESAAALLPLGSTVGTAGLPVMPYSLEFEGGFADIADFFGKLDSTVYEDKDEDVRVNGRLLTIDGFSLAAGPNGFPDLSASVAVTSYLAPQDAGVTAGATPAGPDPTATTPAATDTTTSPPATAAVVGAN